MSITASQYEMVLTKTQSNVEKMGVALGRIRQVIEHRLAYTPSSGGLLVETWNQTNDLASELRAKVEEMLAHARFPAIMDQYEEGWRKIHERADGTASDVRSQIDEARTLWGGDAGAAFQRGVAPQAPAVVSIAGMARVLADTCASLRDAGYAFYLGMGAAVAGCVTTLSTTLEPSVALMALSTAIAAVAAMGAALLARVGAETATLREIPGGTAFPKGAWPRATTS